MMEDRVVLITGSTDGIGKQTALELAQRGIRILVHGKDPKRGKRVIEEISRASESSKLELFIADLSSLNQVRNLAERIRQENDHLDVLINNAGVYEKNYRVSKDGFEMTFAVNHLAHFLLTMLLLDIIKKAPQGRIINVSSIAHFNSPDIEFDNLDLKKRYSGYAAYAQSKLCNVLFTYELAERLKGTNVTVNCLHPGVIDTKLMRASFSMGGAPVTEGAQTPVYLATAPELRNTSGHFFCDQQETASSIYSYDSEVRKQLWQISFQLTGLDMKKFF